MKIAVLGCGNMASALIIPMKGMADFYTYTPSGEKAKKLAELVDGIFVSKLSELPPCDLYMVGCKPQQFADLAKSLQHVDFSSSTILSIMAGVTASTMSEAFKCKSVIRTMPNTPSMVGEGVLALYATSETKPAVVSDVVRLFESGASVYQFSEEDQIDIITPFSGCGPAYLFELGRILQTKMERMGIDSSIAKEMISKTFLGASTMMDQSLDTFTQLRENVTSKKGVTFEALEVFRKSGLEEIASNAIDAAYKRSKELSK